MNSKIFLSSAAKRMLIIFLCFLVLTSALTTCFAGNSGTSGWVGRSGRLFYVKQNGTLASGLTKIGKNLYYFRRSYESGTTGELCTGWVKIGKYKYYFDTKGKTGTKGKMLTNRIVGTKETGYGYVSPKGIKITSEPVKLAVDFVTEHTPSSAGKSKKLSMCFSYLKKNYPYERVYGLPHKENISRKFALKMFKHKSGNCFCYASAYSCIASVLGYKARFNEGTIKTAKRGPSTHGWAEVRIKGKWYLFDISMHRVDLNIPLYKIPKGHYPHKYKYNHSYTTSFKGDKLIWKEL